MLRKKQNNLKQIANFIYESGVLSKMPRSGLWFLGTGRQSVAEHSLRVTYIGYALASMTPKVNLERVVLMCLFHDLAEGRTSDLNYVHQKYGKLAEAQAFADIAQAVPFGDKILGYFTEFEERKSIEAKLTKDADQLEWIATLRDEETKGNIKAKAWSKLAYERLKTPAGQKLGKILLSTHPDDWWFSAKDAWFVDRKQKDQKWKK